MRTVRTLKFTGVISIKKKSRFKLKIKLNLKKMGTNESKQIVYIEMI